MLCYPKKWLFFEKLSVLSSVIKPFTGAQRLRKKESKQVVNSMPRLSIVKKLFIQLTILTETGQQKSILEGVMSVLCLVES